ECDLDRNRNFLGRKPIRTRRFDGGFQTAATPLHLAAFQREIAVIAALVARHDLDLRPEQFVDHRRHGLHLRARAGATDDVLLVEQVLPLRDAGRSPRYEESGGGVDAADPLHFAWIETGALDAIERREGNARVDEADGRAV